MVEKSWARREALDGLVVESRERLVPKRIAARAEAIVVKQLPQLPNDFRC